MAATTSTDSHCLNGDYTLPQTTAAEYDYGETVKAFRYRTYCEPYLAKVALSFYPPNVDKNHPLFGQGKWYIPAIGEWMKIIGWDWDKGLNGYNDSGFITKLNEEAKRWFRFMLRNGILTSTRNVTFNPKTKVIENLPSHSSQGNVAYDEVYPYLFAEF